MKLFLIAICISYVLGHDLRQWDMVPPDDPNWNQSHKNGNSSNNLGICYGSNSNWGSYPYTVALRYTSGSACCSGSIIQMNPAKILTAAHCSGCSGPVRIGCNNPLNCDGDSYSISNWAIHPDYGSAGFGYDVAVVTLQQSITTLGASTISLTPTEPSSGSVRVTGYGQTETGSIPTIFQTMQSSIIEAQLCGDIMSSALGGGDYIDDTMVCIRGGAAGQANVPTMCSGDSGGPIVFGNNQIGVNSWVLQGSGTGCSGCSCCSGYPQVGASSADLYDWIVSQM